MDVQFTILKQSVEAGLSYSFGELQEIGYSLPFNMLNINWDLQALIYSVSINFSIFDSNLHENVPL